MQKAEFHNEILMNMALIALLKGFIKGLNLKEQIIIAYY